MVLGRATSNPATSIACSIACARSRTCRSCGCTGFDIPCATLLFTMCVQPATVQRILRHSSITVTTGTYVEVIEATQDQARSQGFHVAVSVVKGVVVVMVVKIVVN